MAILINGMKMPKSKPICIVIDVAGQARQYDLNNKKYIDDELYEAVPVQDDVDLIDREALMDDIIGSMVFSGREVPKEAAIVQKVLDIVGDASAIIPADKEEQR